MAHFTRTVLCVVLLLLLAGFAQASSVNTSSGWNMPVGVTEISREVYGLHMIIFWICVAIAVVVFGVMFYSLIAYRKSKGAEAAHFHENTIIEVIWTAVPMVILVLMAVPATATLKKMYDTSQADIDILVTGYQWRWRYEYIENDIGFFSNLSTPREQINGIQAKGDNYLLEVDDAMVVPTGQRIRLLLTANDVIHSWWVPDLAVKKDAIPGFINETWFKVDKPGVYRGQCAELCGSGHAMMPIEVRAVSPEDYAIWMENQREAAATEAAGSDREWTMEELMERGEATFTTYCVACHQPDGKGVPPMFPALAGEGIAVDPDALEEHKSIVLHGRSGTAMSAFGETLSAAEIAAVITYERNAWGNDTGDLVQPSAIQALMESQ